MQRYFIHLAYDGSNYHGWQIQPNAPTVQERLEDGLSKLCRTKISVVGCGRTDTGVHARNFYAHFEVENALKSPKEIAYRLNAFLPEDVVVFDVYEVPADFHARFDATFRLYHYYICPGKNPFQTKYSWQFGLKLNIDLMNQAATSLLPMKDFAAFSKTGADNGTTLCDLSQAEWVRENGLLVFKVKANRFLRNMVRAMVGTFVDIGLEKMSLGELLEACESGERSRMGASAPAKGLFLEEIGYPKLKTN